MRVSMQGMLDIPLNFKATPELLNDIACLLTYLSTSGKSSDRQIKLCRYPPESAPSLGPTLRLCAGPGKLSRKRKAIRVTATFPLPRHMLPPLTPDRV